MSSICVDAEDHSLARECRSLPLQCVSPEDEQEYNTRVHTDQRPPEWADASEEVETSTRFDARSVPIGMSCYDSGALSQYQQKRLNQLKVSTVDANYKYLADHPELKAMITLFLHHLLKTRPKNLRASAGEFFRSEKTLAREIRKYLGMKFWKPPARPTPEPSVEASTPPSSQEDEPRPETEPSAEEEETESSGIEEEEEAKNESVVDSSDATHKSVLETQPVSGDTQLMMDMAVSYDSKVILNLSATRSMEKKSGPSVFAFRKQVSFGGSLLPRTPGWEIDPTFHFFIEDIQPEVAQLYGNRQTFSIPRKLKFFGNG